MNHISIFFIYTLLYLLFLPPLFPSLRLLFFAPFLVFTFYHRGKITCLWLALLCGLIIDLFASQTRLGMHALNYCLTTLLLYSQKCHFFEDSPSTLSILTFFFAIFSTLIQVCLLYAFGHSLILSWEWIKNDLFWLPLYDALYAGIAFTLPSLFFPKMSKKRTNLLIT